MKIVDGRVPFAGITGSPMPSVDACRTKVIEPAGYRADSRTGTRA
jgi:hypothetical protein